MRPDNAIYTVINIAPKEFLKTVQSKFKSPIFKFITKKSPKNTIPELYKKHKKIIFCFHNIDVLLKHIEFLKNPPILWCDYPSAKKLELTFKIKPIDYVTNLNGTIELKSLQDIMHKEKNKIKELASKLFTKGKFYSSFRRIGGKNIGSDCEISVYLNKIIESLPFLAYEPLLVAISTSIIKRKTYILKNFIDNNRLITNVNHLYYKHLMECLEKYLSISFYKYVIGKENLSKIHDKHDRDNIKILRIIVEKYGSKNLKEFSDKEIVDRR